MVSRPWHHNDRRGERYVVYLAKNRVMYTEETFSHALFNCAEQM